MANWTFNPAEYQENDFTIIPAGDHRVRVNEVVSKTFNSGREGYEITLEVSGHNSKLWFYLILDPADTKKTNQRIGTFFESFGITDYDMTHFNGWIGKVGAVRVKHEAYNGSDQAKVAFCLSKKNQEKLPAAKFSGNAPAPVAGFTTVEDPDDLPF